MCLRPDIEVCSERTSNFYYNLLVLSLIHCGSYVRAEVDFRDERVCALIMLGVGGLGKVRRGSRSQSRFVYVNLKISSLLRVCEKKF